PEALGVAHPARITAAPPDDRDRLLAAGLYLPQALAGLVQFGRDLLEVVKKLSVICHRQTPNSLSMKLSTSSADADGSQSATVLVSWAPLCALIQFDSRVCRRTVTSADTSLPAEMFDRTDSSWSSSANTGAAAPAS